MTYIGASNNNNTLLEQLDWAYLVCRLGGATSTECPTQAVPVGSGAGVAAGPRFVISGVTNGTVAGTRVLESFFSTDMLPTPLSPSSPYRLVYRNGTTILANLGLPVQTESAHAHDDDGPVPPALTLFSGAFDFQTAATRIELWNGNPGTGTLLYSRDRTGAPVLSSLSVASSGGGAANYTNDAVDVDFAPALSADGRWIAWAAFIPTEGTPSITIRVAPVDDVSQQVRLMSGVDEVDSADPAWCADGSRLAYTDPIDGGVWTVSLEIVGSAASFGTPALLYDAAAPGHFDASRPTWSPDCAQLAFEADNDIWRIDANGDNLVALTDDDASHDPSWSPDPSDNRVAFVHETSAGFAPVAAGGPATATYASFVSPTPRRPTALLAPLQLTVNTTGDGDDGTCNAAHCSLREAINAANASPNDTTPDQISFGITPAGPHSINPGTALPALTEAVIIDGTTQPGWAAAPIIEVNGTGAPAGTDGFSVTAGAAGSTIRGLAINRFPHDGIHVSGNDTVIEANYIGLALDGTTNSGNGSEGVNVQSTGLTTSPGSGSGRSEHQASATSFPGTATTESALPDPARSRTPSSAET